MQNIKIKTSLSKIIKANENTKLKENTGYSIHSSSDAGKAYKEIDRY